MNAKPTTESRYVRCYYCGLGFNVNLPDDDDSSQGRLYADCPYCRESLEFQESYVPAVHYQPPHYDRHHDLDAAGIACSTISLVFGCIAFLCYPPLFGLVGVALGIVGTSLSRNKSLGIIATVVSALGTVCGMILGAVVALTRFHF